jgi:hypothetical protein
MRFLLRDLVDAVHPDRDTSAAFHRGAAAILLAIAATLTIVGVLMTACGCGWWCTLIGLPLLVPAAAFALWALALRVSR